MIEHNTDMILASDRVWTWPGGENGGPIVSSGHAGSNCGGPEFHHRPLSRAGTHRPPQTPSGPGPDRTTLIGGQQRAKMREGSGLEPSRHYVCPVSSSRNSEKTFKHPGLRINIMLMRRVQPRLKRGSIHTGQNNHRSAIAIAASLDDRCIFHVRAI